MNSVTSMGDYAFSECSNLKSLTLSKVRIIGKYAFEKCSSIESIAIPNGVLSIEPYTFSGCSSLTSIEIPNSVQEIGECAFCGCSKFTSMEIPSSVETIGASAFLGCSSLMSIAIPNGVTSIENSTFYKCSSLTSVEIPDGVTSIGYDAFYECSSLASIEIPSSVTDIQYNSHPFYGCTGLTSIIVDKNNMVYDSRDNCNAIIETSTNTLIYGCNNTTIPSGVTSIGDGAFMNCTGLTSIEIPNGVTTIGDDAFKGCSSLTSITIPNSIKSIGSYAFSDPFPSSYPRYYILCYAGTPPEIYNSSFFMSAPLYVPCNALDAYKTDNTWKWFDDKECIEAKHVDEPLDDVVITPSNTKVVVAWPVVDNAESYVIEIKTGGKTFCVVTFNNKGQLLSIEYSSASERMAEARDASAAYGYQYSIGSLTPETQYSYTITALDASERTLSLKSGSFTTTREPVSVDEQSAEPEFKDKVYVQDKNIMVEGLSSDDFSIYNTAGKQVSNPVPTSGVYVVKVGDEAVKVMVK